MSQSMQQVVLGDLSVEEQREERRRKIDERLLEIGAQLGAEGLTKHKHALCYFDNIEYKNLGGQQLTAHCMFCGMGPISSTGSTRLVEHLAICRACPQAVQQQVDELLGKSSKKRKAKADATQLAAEEADRALRAHKVCGAIQVELMPHSLTFFSVLALHVGAPRQPQAVGNQTRAASS